MIAIQIGCSTVRNPLLLWHDFMSSSATVSVRVVLMSEQRCLRIATRRSTEESSRLTEMT